MTKRYLFDSHALLAFFQKERGTEVVAKILRRALKQRLDRLICVINLGEIIYMTKRRFGDRKKVEILGRVHQLGFKVLPAPESLVYKAAELKVEYPIS
ncbi:MAG: PIN domain-containing protein [Desulfobacterales bacterium]